MKRTLTATDGSKPEGMFRKIIFPNLADLDTWVGEGIQRRIGSEGLSVRDLPRTIFMQFEQAPGHDGSVAVGALFEVTVDPDAKLASGWGWLIDDENGHKAARYVASRTLRHNSVDLADTTTEIDFGETWDDPIKVDFVKSNIGATTLVGMPAFANARAEMADDEMVASLLASEEPLVVYAPTLVYRSDATPPTQDEIVASANPLPAWEMFHHPEPSAPHKVTILEDGETIIGHLALWNSCHDGYEAQCVIPPRPLDNYASFNEPGVLTDRGMVNTGPLFFLGGHPAKPLGDRTVEQAYGGIENCFADVRVIPGKFGPWISGRVRPGTSEDAIYAARASKYSGHWKGGRLMAAVCCNVPGYPVGTYTTADGVVDEMIASFPGCAPSGAPDDTLNVTVTLDDQQVAEIIEEVTASVEADDADDAEDSEAFWATLALDPVDDDSVVSRG